MEAPFNALLLISFTQLVISILDLSLVLILSAFNRECGLPQIIIQMLCLTFTNIMGCITGNFSSACYNHEESIDNSETASMALGLNAEIIRPSSSEEGIRFQKWTIGTITLPNIPHDLHASACFRMNIADHGEHTFLQDDARVVMAINDRKAIALTNSVCGNIHKGDSVRVLRHLWENPRIVRVLVDDGDDDDEVQVNVPYTMLKVVNPADGMRCILQPNAVEMGLQVRPGGLTEFVIVEHLAHPPERIAMIQDASGEKHRIDVKFLLLRHPHDGRRVRLLDDLQGLSAGTTGKIVGHEYTCMDVRFVPDSEINSKYLIKKLSLKMID